MIKISRVSNGFFALLTGVLVYPIAVFLIFGNALWNFTIGSRLKNKR